MNAPISHNSTKKMNVPFVNLAAQFAELEDQLVDVFKQIGRSGMYVFGQPVEQFEQGLAEICQSKYALSVANGTDAIVLALQAYGIGRGDEVITAPNSFIASAGAINEVGATIRFADVGTDYNLDPAEVEKAITEKTKAIIAVHLTGNPAKMDELNQIAHAHNLILIEDAAQAIGAEYKGRKVGSLGHVACFSLHPLKNFHLMGDAGFVTTQDQVVFEKMKMLRNHGLKNRDEAGFWGQNSRCDALQAAIGNAKLPYFSKWTERFQAIAHRYHEGLKSIVICPEISADSQAVFHNFVIQVSHRSAFMQALLERGVESKIHYPIPLHLMQAAQSLGYQKGDFPITENQSERIMSLPIYPELTDEQVKYVIQSVIQVAEQLNAK
ncbi:DegT/DnrJ/EryC1/StrS family aminotransferase [Catenovulum sp. 2E275]|uniref:DegT/DnrJ/EryC1/StrS family aminotransferase n=1 Tax=Catenovulum sp. 2E275 TaxID=2980497 RepID=UPI0021CFACED|nr:DegT/DnrJ/EryC1/StrS family aminotransferase [Catenovulum sp. 2E275]MCU4674735.1 DegT/DnrJ/EryC1/StrS family aminotransferase [Catenovulum sp. 2E275]